jgi:hypothetical protein
MNRSLSCEYTPFFYKRGTELISSSAKAKDMPRLGTASGSRHREATPLREMENPVLEVLEGMRVQRMSLVQSLRQFVFVHRGMFLLVLLNTRHVLTNSNHDGLHPAFGC